MKFTSYFYETALHMAIKRNNIEIIQILLEHEKIDINIKNSI